jgi:hypothetical protein
MATLVTYGELARFRKALAALDETDAAPFAAVPALIGTARRHLREGFAMGEARQAADVIKNRKENGG